MNYRIDNSVSSWGLLITIVVCVIALVSFVIGLIVMGV